MKISLFLVAVSVCIAVIRWHLGTPVDAATPPPRFSIDSRSDLGADGTILVIHDRHNAAGCWAMYTAPGVAQMITATVCQSEIEKTNRAIKDHWTRPPAATKAGQPSR